MGPMGHCNTSQWLTGCLHVAPFFCVDSWVAHLDVTNTHTFGKEWKSWMWMQLCVQLETCAVKIHKNALIHRNGSPDFSNQSNTIQNNKKRETMGRQMLAKLCSSTAVDDGVTLRASTAHAYNAKLHDLLNLCSALKSPCRVHAIWRVCFKKKKDTILTFNDGWHMIKTRHAQNVLFSCILTLRPFMVSPPPNMKYPECSGPQKKQIHYSSPLGSLLLNLGEKG